MRLRFVVLALAVCMWAGAAFGQTTIGGDESGHVTFSNTQTFAVAVPSKTVEPLTKAEVDALHEAQVRVDEAQRWLKDVQQSLKLLHGERHNLCSGFETAVSFFGDYALVDTEPASGCVSSGTFQMNTVPYNTYPFDPAGTATVSGGVITAQYKL